MPRLFVLDAMGLAYRAYHALLTRRGKTAGEVEAERRQRLERGETDPEINPVKWASLSTSKGEPSGAILGMSTLLLKVRREERPDFWALAWDGPGATFRHERFPDYKATRKPMPEDLLAQIEPIETLAQALGLPVIQFPGMEADDVMATLARRGLEDGLEVMLLTGDKDMFQVLREGVTAMVPQRPPAEGWVRMDPAAVREKWGVGPENLRDVLALMGDSVDNIPGVPGIGEKTAVDLMRTFGSLDALYERLDEVKKPALKAKLEAYRELAFLSRELATVRDDLDLPVTWEDLRCQPLRREVLREFARRWELKRLATVAESEDMDALDTGPRGGRRDRARIGGGTAGTPPPVAAPVANPREEPPAPAPVPRAASAPAPPAAAETVAAPRPQETLDLFADSGTAVADLESCVASIHEVRARAIHGLALVPLWDGDAPRRARLVGLALAAKDGTAAYLPLAHQTGPNLTLERARAWLGPALADPTVPKVGADLKRDAHVLAAAGLALAGLDFDVHLGSFLCDPERDHSLDALARDVLGVELPLLVPPPTRGKPRPTWAALPLAQAAPVAAARAGALHPLADALRAQIESREQGALYGSLEHPLIPVLLEMERHGIAVDRARLEEMGRRAGQELLALEERLYELAGERINLLSGPQLSRVLFEGLRLKPGRRTKTGYSTDQEVLESLATQHPFPKVLLEYRVLAKLKSTYLDALPLEIDPGDGRVHTTYHQAGAATGRLSSSDPNLQNIPMRTEQGRAIRGAFVAPPGMLLVGADYSQIELRLMAHLSGDAALIDTFRSGGDVHAETARRVFGLGDAPATPGMRARAKVVNFGIMYGMGARSLAQQMGATVAEAEEFIRGYFRVFAGVREYLDATLAEARRRGYVQTLLGRRRWLPQLESDHGGLRSLAERAAINAPIQGSAADLMKLAMIRVHGALKQDRPSARLLLQVHDELLLECPAAEAQAVSELVRAEMENVFALRVPLVASAGIGATWLDVH